MSALDPKALEEMKRRVEAATPGTWWTSTEDDHDPTRDGYAEAVLRMRDGCATFEDYYLIGHAAEWLRLLLAEVERLRGENERLMNAPRNLVISADAKLWVAESERAAKAESRIQELERQVVEISDRLDSDPHQWSKRPCSTCGAITKAIGRDFGCVAYSKSHLVYTSYGAEAQKRIDARKASGEGAQ